MVAGYERHIDMKHELESRTVDYFAVLDLDRTLLDSDKIVRLMCEALPRFGVDEQAAQDDLDSMRAATGRSLSAFEFLAGRHGDETVRLLVSDMFQRAENGRLDDKDLLYGDSSVRLLDELDERDIPFAVLTYGEQDYQEFKLALYRILTGRYGDRLPAVVTDEPRKGDWIHGHWSDGSDDHMRVPADFTGDDTIVAREVVIIDDKLHNLESPDGVVKGIHIDNRHDRPAGRVTIQQVVEQLQSGVGLNEIATHHTPVRQG